MSDGRASYAIAAGRTRHEGRRLDIGENQQQTLTIHVPTVHRGRLPLGRIRIWTEFPLGLFHVWTWVEPDASLVVYPQPAGKRYRLASGLTGAGRLAAQTAGYDDFAGLRRYHPGDSLRHIDWKAAARRHQILTKQFSDPAGDDIWLDWDQLPGLKPEQRLSQLCRWVLDLHRLNCHYGLKLPHYRIEPAGGEVHKHHCLTRLALFEY
jgi:uncharacterized protein (DUF58 family)